MIPSPLATVPSFGRSTAPFGELLAAVFDEASNYSTDPQEISRMTAEVVARILRRTIRTPAR